MRALASFELCHEHARAVQVLARKGMTPSAYGQSANTLRAARSDRWLVLGAQSMYAPLREPVVHHWAQQPTARAKPKQYDACAQPGSVVYGNCSTAERAAHR